MQAMEVETYFWSIFESCCVQLCSHCVQYNFLWSSKAMYPDVNIDDFIRYTLLPTTRVQSRPFFFEIPTAHIRY